VFQVEIDDGVHSDSASLGSNPSPPARMSITSRQMLTILLGLPRTSPPSIGSQCRTRGRQVGRKKLANLGAIFRGTEPPKGDHSARIMIALAAARKTGIGGSIEWPMTVSSANWTLKCRAEVFCLRVFQTNIMDPDA
jgi:hypothetical protein